MRMYVNYRSALFARGETFNFRAYELKKIIAYSSPFDEKQCRSTISELIVLHCTILIGNIRVTPISTRAFMQK